jgi:SAM-dependent methyltransferase
MSKPRTAAATDNERVRALVEAVPADASVLDLGCVQHDASAAASDAWVHDHLVDKCERVVGVDYLPDEVATLRQQGYDVRCGDATALDLGEQFDVVVAGELIEHLADLAGFLDSVAQHLRSDGRFLLTTPNPWLFHRFKQALIADSVACNDEHTCWLDEQTLRQLLGRHGFVVERIDHVRPTDAGLSQVLFDLGRSQLGGASLLVVAAPEVGDA